MTETEIRDKIAAIELISPTIAAWVKFMLSSGLTWANVQTEWRLLEELILGDRKKAD